MGAGAVLLQISEDGIYHPVGFFSRKFNAYQLNYSMIEKEALAHTLKFMWVHLWDLWWFLLS